MGLVTESNFLNPKVIKLFKDPLLILIYIVGVVWFLFLPHENLNSPTYFSENALLPGLVESELYQDYGATLLSNELEALLKDRRENYNYDIPTKWLSEKLKKNGLQAYYQNYSFSYPHEVYKEHSEAMKGTNVYTIIRTPRSTSVEAIVINVPFNNHPSKDGKVTTNHAAIALIISLAKALRKKSYWSKDLVFVISDNGEVGINAWLSAYHHIPNQYIKAQVLPARSGVIQAALVLELQSKVNSFFTVKTEGLNGKLPNLDLFNTVDRLLGKEGSRTQLIEAHNTWMYQLKNFRRWRSFINMASMMWHLASNFPTGNHGYFLPYSIESLTIKGVDKKGYSQLGIMDVQRVMEGILRSLNNLLERFHQSFFFYLIPSPSRYVSIGVYMPPVGLMLFPIVLKALRIKIEISEEEEMRNKEKETKNENKTDNENVSKDEPTKSDEDTPIKEEIIEEEKPDEKQTEDPLLRNRFEKKEKASKDNLETKEDTAEKNENISKDVQKSREEKSTDASVSPNSTSSLLSFILYTSMALSIPVVFFYSTGFFIRSSRDFQVEMEDSMSICFIIAHLSIVFYPFLFSMYTRKADIRVDVRHIRLLNLILLGVFCGAFSVVNVSLFFFVLLLWTPLVILNGPNNRFRIVKLLKVVMTLILSPLCILYVASIIHLYIANKAKLPSLHASFRNLGDGLMSSMLNYHLFNLWSFPLIYLLFLPVWTLLWLTAINF